MRAAHVATLGFASVHVHPTRSQHRWSPSEMERTRNVAATWCSPNACSSFLCASSRSSTRLAMEAAATTEATQNRTVHVGIFCCGCDHASILTNLLLQSLRERWRPSVYPRTMVRLPETNGLNGRFRPCRWCYRYNIRKCTFDSGPRAKSGALSQNRPRKDAEKIRTCVDAKTQCGALENRAPSVDMSRFSGIVP